jgi:cysteine-rich repeat protein
MVPATGYCDDGGTTAGDGCDASCAVETDWSCTAGDSTTASVCTKICGNGIVGNPLAGYCDDGDTNNGDGCSSTCAVETDWTCTLGDSSTASVCTDI